MLMFYLVIITFAISTAVGAVVTNIASSTSCRASEFTCQDGTCVSAVSVCDGNSDCADGSDEASCYSSTYQLPGSSVPQWRCADGTNITWKQRCDGKFDCPDKSDETHALCTNSLGRCLSDWFMCTYGACVDKTAPCNGVYDCVDHSDELLPMCGHQSRVINGKFLCLDGNAISVSDACDGTPNCPDGTDETVTACTGQTCSVHQFQCAYGACVEQRSRCNGKNDCADGSDELGNQCGNNMPLIAIPLGDTPPVNVPAATNTPATPAPAAPAPAAPSGCLLPEYPAHGSYEVINSPNSQPRQSLPFAYLKITCVPGYGVVGDALVYCQDGKWRPIPKCVPHCKLEPHISVQYNCIISYGTGVRPCREYEPTGTRVTPECKPNYFSNENTLYMTCNKNGDWNRIVTCEPECGRVTPISEKLIAGGNKSRRGELPWYVAIYKNPTQAGKKHELICGGTIVSTRVVISAGHCFWGTFGAEDASLFAVATAKLFREWDHIEDRDVQKSNILSINFTDHYFGANANEQDDIAILILETPIKYYSYVRPVCLDFKPTFNYQQLQEGNLGKVAGFGLTAADDNMGSPVLKTVSLPYVPIRQCQKLTPESFTENLSGDKICAGYTNGTAALCKGDSGGGLAFPAQDRAVIRYFLRGIASTAPRPSSQSECNTETVITFTSIIKHELFIKQFL